MTIHRCDVCRDEHPERNSVTRVEVRFNLYGLAGTKDPNHVLIGVDVCEKTACRVTGLKQLSEAGLLAALERADLPSPGGSARRAPESTFVGESPKS